MSPSDTVRQLFDAICAKDRERVLGFFDDASVFNNMPVGPRTGRDAIWRELAQVLDLADKVDWQVHTIAETADGHVLTERTDRFHINGTWVEFPVMGIIELRDDIVVEWRDYFDLQQGLAAMNQASERQ